MKKMILLFIALSLLTFGASYNVQEPKALSESSMIEFEMEKKEPWGAVAGAFLLPSVGHAYAGDWGRGLKFLGGEFLALLVMSEAASDNITRYSYNYYSGYTYYEEGTDNDWLIGVGAITLIGLRIWEHVDAYKTAKDYNKNLYRKLSLLPVVSAENKSVGMKLSYNF